MAAMLAASWTVPLAASGAADQVLPVSILLLVVALAYLGMWRGWRGRQRRHDILPLVPVPESPAPARLRSESRYYGTTLSGRWLDRVTSQGLGARSSGRVTLSDEGIDVERPQGPFRIPAAAIRGARHDQGIAGKVVPPHGVLVVTWQHGDLLLDSGFRLKDHAREVTALHDDWIREIEALVREGEPRHDAGDDKEPRP